MNEEKLNIIKNGKGFIAALDQSGGSSGKTLELYGISKDQYTTDQEMFDFIHEMRKRIITSKSFTNEHILGVILFEGTMNRQIEGENSSNYLWNKKHILSFLKVDQGLEELKDGVQLMKSIPNLIDLLTVAKSNGIFGTKMRSVIHEDNEAGIKKVVEQQFVLAQTIFSKGLIPIIEPEVSINATNKENCEILLKQEIEKQLTLMKAEMKVIFKFTLPTVTNFYEDLETNPQVLRIVALSGGYSKKEACLKLSQNKGMIASFSRALLENLNVNDSDEEFDQNLQQSIQEIYDASIV